MQSKPVLIVEDHPATLLGVRALIESLDGYSTVAVVKTGEEAVERAADAEPELVCLDLALAGRMDGFETCEQICALPNPPAVVVYTGQEEPGVVTRARDAGAIGVVAKSEAFKELTTALQLAVEGRPYTSPLFARGAAVPELSERQRSVLALMARGLDNNAIAETMGVGTETVKTHVRAVLKKLEANDRTHAVAIGLRYAHIA